MWQIQNKLGMTLISEFQYHSIGEVSLRQESGHFPRNHPLYLQQGYLVGLSKLVLFYLLFYNKIVQPLKQKAYEIAY